MEVEGYITLPEFVRRNPRAGLQRLQKMCRRKQLPHVRLGHLYLVHPERVRLYLAGEEARNVGVAALPPLAPVVAPAAPTPSGRTVVADAPARRRGRRG